MKVVLLTTPVTVYGSGIIKPMIPLGLMYIGAYLRQKDIEVKIVDILALGIGRVVKHREGRRYGLSNAQIAKLIRKEKPEWVGISNMFTAYRRDAIELSEVIKEVDSKIKIVVGGAHVSIDPEAVLEEGKNFDIAVVGEGELTFEELVSGQRLSDVAGICYRRGRKIVRNKSRELIRDLDQLPFPAWELIDTKRYLIGGPFNKKYPVYPMISSRGCPNHCLYCSIHSLWQHKWRGRSAKNVVDEIEYYRKQFGVEEVSFQDDSMSVNKKRMEEICDEIIARKLKVEWTTPNGIAHWTLTKPLLKKMKQSGCYRITFGIESGDPETRRWVGKPFSLEQAKELTQYANKIGMWTLSTNIIGFPYDTEKEILNTAKFALDSGVDQAFFYILGPRPGTPIYEIFKKEGWLMKDENLLFSEDVACRTKYFTGQEIVTWQKKLYQDFYKQRWLNLGAVSRVFNKIKNWEDAKYIWKIGKHGIKLINNIWFGQRVVSSKTLRV